MNEDQEEQKIRIREVIGTWMRATAEGDLEQVLSLMAEDVVFLLPGQPPMRRRDAFAAATRSALAINQLILRLLPMWRWLLGAPCLRFNPGL